MRYLMKQRLFSWGDDFYIRDAEGRDVFFVDGKALSFGDQLSFQDLQKNELAYIKQKLSTTRASSSAAPARRMPRPPRCCGTARDCRSRHPSPASARGPCTRSVSDRGCCSCRCGAVPRTSFPIATTSRSSRWRTTDRTSTRGRSGSRDGDRCGTSCGRILTRAEIGRAHV